MTELVVASDLAIEYETARGTIRALDGANLTIEAGTSIGLVGESGSGKTTLGMAMGRLLPSGARRVAGSLSIGSLSIFDLDDRDVVSLRRRQLGFVFQDPMLRRPAFPPQRRRSIVRRPVCRSASRSSALISKTAQQSLLPRSWSESSAASCPTRLCRLKAIAAITSMRTMSMFATPVHEWFTEGFDTLRSEGGQGLAR